MAKYTCNNFFTIYDLPATSFRRNSKIPWETLIREPNNLSEENLSANMFISFYLANPSVFPTYVCKARFSISNHVRENFGSTGSRLPVSSLVTGIWYSFSLPVFPSCIFLGCEVCLSVILPNSRYFSSICH